MKKYKIGGQFSGVGAFDQALIRLGIDYENVYQAEWDKFARQTYLHNYEKPLYYVEDVYDTDVEDITNKHGALDIMMFSPPCQAFSLAGKRKGEEDDRGVLFYNSHEFIQKNKPRYFIFENVKGLLSDDNGKTFQRWVDFLGGKSVNGNPVIFPHEESTPYHIYYQVLNAKHYGVPQNRERIFIVGIRDDEDNNFTFPKPFELEKRLKDVLETNVDEKYFLSDLAIVKIKKSQANKNIETDEQDISRTIIAGYYKIPFDGQCVKVTNFQGNDILNSIRVGGRGTASNKHNWDIIKIKSANNQGYEVAEHGDSINLEHPNSETRRGRVGKGVAQTLTTSCNQAVYQDAIRKLTARECFRLMDFPDSFSWPVSDSQAYKQAGNSIVVNVLAQIINKLNLF